MEMVGQVIFFINQKFEVFQIFNSKILVCARGQTQESKTMVYSKLESPKG